MLYKGSHILLILLLSIVYHTVTAQYTLYIVPVDADSIVSQRLLPLQSTFKSKSACELYINNLVPDLHKKGFVAASLDSVRVDSAVATIHVYLGKALKVAYINTAGVEKRLLQQSNWEESRYIDKPLRPDELTSLQRRILEYLENHGYPFAKVQLDSIDFREEGLHAKLVVDKGPLYKIDSIRLFGNVRISKKFLQRYLDISNGSTYEKAKLETISKKLRELPYVQEEQTWNLTLLGTGSILNVYLKPRRSSQVNVLVGFLPSTDAAGNSKMLLSGEANINLKNALGNGETISLNWQQLQQLSPRLDLAFQQPYIFGSAFGIATSFNLFKKDSSYINLSLLLGIQYSLSSSKWGKVFVENLKTNLLSVDTSAIKATKRLPDEIDVSSINLGVDYNFNNTNFRFNPRSGSELQLMFSAGSRKIRENNIIVNIKDPNFSYASLYDTVDQNSYQFRSRVNAAHYFPLGKQSTFKTSVNGGWFQSPSIFRNELFQIGGYKLLRGFDEESIYASSFVVGTLEYRYLLGLNSFLFSFLDLGWAANKSSSANTKNQFLGAGAGLAFETKAGIFNISYAVGKRDDQKFDVRQSKIHLGYINFF